MVLVATQVKRRRGTTAENDAFTGAEGEITVDIEKHELRVHDGVTQGGFVIGAGGSGAGRNIGDVFMTKRTDTALAGAVECNGGTYNTEDYEGDGSIGELLEAGKLDYISLTDYATAISTKGWCDKIGWNGTGTTSFRVPTLTPHIIQKNNIPVVGNGMTLGMTNGTKNAGMYSDSGGGKAFRESVYNIPVSSSGKTGSNLGGNWGVTTDGTKSGIIADTSDTAQLRIMFQLFNGTTDEAVATVGTVIADVAELKDMSNITATGKEAAIDWIVPDYTARTTKSKDIEYTAETSGWLKLYGQNGSSNPFELKIDNESVFYNPKEGNHYNTYPPIFIGKGQKYKLTGGGTLGVFVFYPTKGGI